jgi:hypothetical protein
MNNSMTEKQENCIHVLCTKLGRAAPDGMGSWTRRQASECIEELAKEVDGSKGAFQDASQLGPVNGVGSGLSRDSQVRLGLAAKLVHHQWAMARKRPVNGARDEFKKEVAELFTLLNEVEQHVLNGGGLHA